jgi:DNA-binding GntR family transcriptional regulator
MATQATVAPVDGSRAARLHTSLKEAIARGEYLPGAHLVEAEVARRYAASRATVREVLRRLSADDLVEHVTHRGVRVRRLTLPDIVEIYTVREPIEALAARLAAQAPKAAHRPLVALQRDATGAVRAGDRVRFARINSTLHRAVAEAAGNRALLTVLSRLNAPLIGLQFASVDGALDIDRAHRDHQVVLDAIVAREPAAAETAMRRHLRHSRDLIVQALRAQQTVAAGGHGRKA